MSAVEVGTKDGVEGRKGMPVVDHNLAEDIA